MTRASVEIEPIPADLTTAVSVTLDRFIDAKQHQLAPIGVDLVPLIDAARRAVSGGKRLRPAFAYWGWRGAGGSTGKAKQILSAAAAIELVHASALVHDDVMDDSATRRGRPASHRAFSQLVTADGTPAVAQRFGRAAAILLGDMLLSWSDELLGHSGFKPKAVVRGRVYFDQLRTEVVAGQYLDVLAQTRRQTGAAESLRIVRYKSAKYTVERPLQFGAALAKAEAPLLAALSSYGVPLGEAFQLRDDILGVFGQTELTGKPSGDDIREGKRTLLLARAYAKATPAQRSLLDRVVADPRVDAAGIADVQQVINDTGALSSVETVITELTAAALAALSRIPLKDEESRAALHELSDRVTNRNL